MRIRIEAQSTSADALGTLNPTPGTEFFIAGKFVYDDGEGNSRLSIWVNPTGVEEAAPGYTASLSWETIDVELSRIQLIQYGTATTITDFGNIRVGTSWEDVAAIPEAGTTQAVVLGSLLLGATALLRRKGVIAPRG